MALDTLYWLYVVNTVLKSQGQYACHWIQNFFVSAYYQIARIKIDESNVRRKYVQITFL